MYFTPKRLPTSCQNDAGAGCGAEECRWHSSRVDQYDAHLSSALNVIFWKSFKRLISVLITHFTEIQFVLLLGTLGTKFTYLKLTLLLTHVIM